MGKHIHLLSNIDPDARTAICAACGPTTLRSKGDWWRCKTAAKQSKGKRSRAAEARKRQKRRPYRRWVKDACERCGFTVGDKRALDGHHRNHDHTDNREANIETLCPTCHRLEHLGIQLKEPLPQQGL